MRRGGIALLVVALAVTAGCSALDGSGGSGGPEGPVPPGVAENGSVNETALLAAHSEATNGSTVRIAHRNGERRTVAYRGPNGTYTRDDAGATWTGGGKQVSNDTVGGADYEFDYDRNTSTGASTGASTVQFGLAVRLGTAEYEHATTRTVDGTDLHELELAEASGFGEQVGHYTGTMLVDERGRIHRLSGEIGDNETVADAYEYRFDWRVDSVPDPSWLDAVPRGEARKVDSGTVFAVESTGSATIPAGTELEFSHDGDRHSLVLNESLAPGETLALGLRESGTGNADDGTAERTLVVSRDSLDGADLVDLRGERTQLHGTVTTGDGATVSVTLAVGSGF